MKNEMTFKVRVIKGKVTVVFMVTGATPWEKTYPTIAEALAAIEAMLKS